MCLRNLAKRKMRTFLTLLGVMIGTGSIILMISLGLATEAQFAQMIEDVGFDMTAINVWEPWESRRWNPDGTPVETEHSLTDEIADRIQNIEGVLVATPMMNGYFLMRSGPYALDAWNVIGMRPEALELMGLKVEYGRLLEAGEEGFNAVFGSKAERQFFSTIRRGGQTWFGSDRAWREMAGEEVETYVDVFNDPIRIYYDSSAFWNSVYQSGDDFMGVAIDDAFEVVRSFPLNVVGVLEHNENDMRGENHQIYVDIETLKTLNQLSYQSQRRNREENEWQPSFSMSQGGPRETYDQIFVRAAHMDDTRRVAEAIEKMGLGVHFQGDWIDQQRQSQRNIQTLLAVIAAVSLFVAAINIANTMITSVTERTKEIGIMKVIGASISDILKLFLLEAIVIGILGGILGIVIALGSSFAINNLDIEFLNNLNLGGDALRHFGSEDAAISLITPWLCGLALAVAGGIGMVSGFFPAWRATRLSALSAIRGD
jgi:ABC-type lipoprotein release transport system permease subunit